MLSNRTEALHDWLYAACNRIPHIVSQGFVSARTADRSPTAHRLTASDPHKDLPLQLPPSSQHAFHNECNGPSISKLNRHAAPMLVLHSQKDYATIRVRVA